MLGKIADHIQGCVPRDTLLVTNRLGKPVRRNSFGFCWRAAVETGRPARRGAGFHDLRHFYASTLIAAGLHPKVIQERLGHATMAETMDTSGHLFPSADEAGRGALDAAFASQASTSGQA